MAARMYMMDNNDALYHHHELWVLDDGSLIPTLPATVAGCVGGGSGNSQAEKPWVIFFYPYLKSRQVTYCPDDPAPRSQFLATNLYDYNGNAVTLGTECDLNPNGELCRAETSGGARWAIESYLLNSIFTHKSCRYNLEGVLPSFATDAVINSLPNPNVIMFSERDSTALDDCANGNDNFGCSDGGWGYVPQDDYDTWPGEANLVRNGTGAYPNQGWITYDRHNGGANYCYVDGHVKWLRWSAARLDEFPDHIVRLPLANPPV